MKQVTKKTKIIAIIVAIVAIIGIAGIFAYFTDVATVTNKGVIKGKKKGTCYIYVYAQNGISKKVKVTVK